MDKYFIINNLSNNHAPTLFKTWDRAQFLPFRWHHFCMYLNDALKAPFKIGKGTHHQSLNIVANEETLQRTVCHSVEFSGIGLHSGTPVTVRLQPAPENTGIIFRRTDLENFEIEAHMKYVSRVVLATTLMKKGVMLSTVEHLLSALYGLGIDNLVIEIDSLELPIADGSALPFAKLIKDAGIQEQESERTYLLVTKPLTIKDREKFIKVCPSNDFSIRYEIDFDHPLIKHQVLEMEITPENYFSEIAFARTFGFLSEVEQLRKSNLIRGGSLKNAVVLSQDTILSGKLRAPDEFVRHKALDLIGDIALCGHPILGNIHAYKAGHALHTRLATSFFHGNSYCELVSESNLPTTS